jgi:hypothetical protein
LCPVSRSESLYENPPPVQVTAPRKPVAWATTPADRVGVLGGAGRPNFFGTTSTDQRTLFPRRLPSVSLGGFDVRSPPFRAPLTGRLEAIATMNRGATRASPPGHARR